MRPTIFYTVLFLVHQFVCVFSKISTDDSALATSPKNCFSSFECPSNTYCYWSEPYDPVYRCKKCPSTGGPTKCSPPLETGALCGKDGAGTCFQENVCRKMKDGKMRCILPRNAVVGSPCSPGKGCFGPSDVFLQEFSLCQEGRCWRTVSRKLSMSEQYQCYQQEVCSVAEDRETMFKGQRLQVFWRYHRWWG